jgi:hypothetical protein
MHAEVHLLHIIHIYTAEDVRSPLSNVFPRQCDVQLCTSDWVLALLGHQQ